MNHIHISRRHLLAAALGTVGAATVPSATRGEQTPTAPTPSSAPPRHLPIHETTGEVLQGMTGQTTPMETDASSAYLENLMKMAHKTGLMIRYPDGRMVEILDYPYTEEEIDQLT